MNQHFSDRDLLVRDIKRHDEEVSSHDRLILISVDGLGGTGNSTLAQAIAGIGTSHIVSLDDYLMPHMGTYIDHLRYSGLEAVLSAEGARDPKFLIVEGLCVLAVLGKLGRQSDIAVYIRRVDEYGNWCDEFYYSEHYDLGEVLGRLSEIDARYPDMPGIGDKDRELVRYHVERRPITSAHYVYDRIRHPPTGEGASA